MADINSLPDRDTMYDALVRKDTGFEGIFFAAIRTTGIFCRPSCTARKPKPENVEYFPDAKSAMANGFRPCKICHPLEPLGSTPEWLQALLREVDQDPSIRLRAADLRMRGLDPARVRRWFKKWHSMTFATYLRMRRINQAFGQIRYNGQVTDAALASGYESLSGFGDGFKKTMGSSPANSNGRQVITVTRLSTPLGPMLAGATEDGVCLLEFSDRPMLETQINRLQERLSAKTLPGDSSFIAQLDSQLQAYFSHRRTEFTVPLITPGTEFQQKVWSALCDIPFGETRTYSQQAANIGQPTAVRAVARANGDNRIAIVIPCHRVIGADGGLTGYGGGLWRKKRLLEIERASSDDGGAHIAPTNFFRSHHQSERVGGTNQVDATATRLPVRTDS